MYRFVLFVFFITTIGCNKKLLTGKYIAKGSPETLILNIDNTFEYSYLLDGSELSKTSKGMWSFKDGIIILNSNFKRNEYPISVTERKDSSHSYSFKFDTIYTRNLGNNILQELLINDSIRVQINNKLTKFSYDKPINKFKIINYYSNYLNPDNSFDKTRISTLETQSYLVQNNASDFFYIFYEPFNSTLFHYLFFENERFKIKKRYLFWQTERRRLTYDN